MKKSLILLVLILVCCSKPEPNPKIEIYNASIESIIDKGLHEYVGDFIMNINNLDQNIQKQFF